MGFASFLEDISDRYIESSPISDMWVNYAGSRYEKKHIEEAKSIFGDPYEKVRRIIDEFWSYYRFHKPMIHLQEGHWETHFDHLNELKRILQPADTLDQYDCRTAWFIAVEIENSLRSFFRHVEVYGPISPKIIRRVAEDTKTIRTRCASVDKCIRSTLNNISTLTIEAEKKSALLDAKRKLDQISRELESDMRSIQCYDIVMRQVASLSEVFLKSYNQLAIESEHRPALKDLDRLRLHPQQEGLVAKNYHGSYRVQGSSGTGKTIVLVHRALRLAIENPFKHIRVYTINRSLAELISSTVIALHGSIPSNLYVSTIYDLTMTIINMFDHTEKYRLVDQQSGEQFARTWHDFFNHKSRNPVNNVFASPSAIELMQYIQNYRDNSIDICRFLRDEITFIQSSYSKHERSKYVTDSRKERSIPMMESNRLTCLRILEAWEEWLRFGAICDIDSLTLLAYEFTLVPDYLEEIKDEYPTDHVLIDEMQDFSAVELKLLRTLLSDENGENAFFLCGDLQQKVFPKQHNTHRAGLDFSGRATTILRQNYRNTVQILKAAYCLPCQFPPQIEEAVEIIHPSYSKHQGGRPVVLECTPSSHAADIIKIIKLRKNSRLAVVSDNERLLSQARSFARRSNIPIYDLYCLEELDRWRKQGDSLKATLVISRLEAVKGFEFDTVLVADLSMSVIPKQGLLKDDFWREAAIVYSALTRARDELIITYTGEPSIFVHAMEPHVLIKPIGDKRTLSAFLNDIN